LRFINPFIAIAGMAWLYFQARPFLKDGWYGARYLIYRAMTAINPIVVWST
jgi:hypothetical protein